MKGERTLKPTYTFNTNWKDGELVCACTQDGKCNKNHGYEELEFILNSYTDINECMKHDSYMRVKSRMQQRR